MKLLRAEVILFVALLLTIMFVPIAGATADELHAAPINPEFISYMKEKPYDSQVQGGTQHLGLIPSTLYRPEVKDVQMFGSNAGDRATSYNSTYDLRTYNKVSPVKNQNPWGTCWAFATFASLESTSMPATPTPNFSEKNLANLAGFDGIPQDAGGSIQKSMAYLARWNGPVAEATDPYPSGTWTSSSTYPPVKHVQNVYTFPGRTSRTDNDNIKGALTRWGAVYSSLFWYSAFENATYASYYQPASDSGTANGHAITIVGWDDNYAATNFTHTADGPGAWLIKNSWGTSYGENGYYHVSYYDKTFGSAIYTTTGTYKDTAVVFGENTSNYDTVYSYDRLGEVNDYWYGTPKTGSFANVFTANSTETIKAVGFYTTDLNVPYTISIYKNPITGPVGGTPAATFSGTLPYKGYNTVVIPAGQQVPVTAGNRFSVVVQVTNPTNNWYIPYEYNYPGYSSNITSQLGQGYVLGNSEWVDWKTQVDESHICVKAYTSSTTPAPTVTGVSPSSGSVLGGTSVTVTGTGFTGANHVRFGTVANATGAMTINSDTTITVTSPRGSAGIVDITVTTPAGTSTTSSADQFTYIVVPTTSTVGVFRESTGVFYLASSNTPGGGTVNAFNFGMNGDLPVVVDNHVGVFRQSTGTFYLASSNTAGGGTVTAFNFGMNGDLPVVVDNHVGVFRQSTGTFYLASSNTPGGGTVNAFNFGMNGDQPIAATWA